MVNSLPFVVPFVRVKASAGQHGWTCTVLALVVCAAGCSDSGSSSSGDGGSTSTELLATEVAIVEKDSVGASNVEEALVSWAPTIDRVVSLEAKVEKLAQALDDLTESVDDQQTTLQTMGEQLKEFDSKLAATDAAHQALADQFQTQVGDIEVASLQAKLDAAEQDLAVRAAELADLQAKTMQLETLVGEQTAALQGIENGIEALANSVESKNLALEAKITAPRECPPDMVPINSTSCIETSVRGPSLHRFAMYGCANTERRLCGPWEIFTACAELSESLVEFPLEDFPHWTDSAGRLDSVEEAWEHSGFAVGGFGCAQAWEASTTQKAQDTSTALFHYRCCMDRL